MVGLALHWLVLAAANGAHALTWPPRDATAAAQAVAASPAMQRGRAIGGRLRQHARSSMGMVLSQAHDRSLWRMYTRLCKSQPTLANAVTVGTVALLGDLIMQSLEIVSGASAGWDARRCVRFVTIRTAITTTLYTPWLRALDLTVRGLPPLTTGVIKAVLDCAIYTPLYHVTLFSSVALMEGRPWDEAMARCVATLPRSLPASWSFWLPTQTITFSLVPSHLRVTFINAVSLVWNSIMSGLSHATATQAH